jgi:hypothetical protein
MVQRARQELRFVHPAAVCQEVLLPSHFPRSEPFAQNAIPIRLNR